MKYLDRPISDAIKIRQIDGIINHHETIALIVLLHDGPMVMSDLGAAVPLSRAAITALTDRLEFIGFVQRTPDPTDRRRTVLSLTDKAREQIDEALLGTDAEG